MALTQVDIEAIAQIVYDKFVSEGVIDLIDNIPKEVWEDLLSGMVTPESAGERLKELLTTTKYLALK